MSAHVTVISLDRTPERFAKFRELHSGLAIERFPAVDGGRLDRSACIGDGLITEDNHYNAGALGTASSHVALWRQCAAAAGPLHIVEDDVILRADFAAMSAGVLQSLEHWDVVLWTHNFDWPVMVRPAAGVGPVVMQYDPEVAAREVDTFRAGRLRPMLVPLASAAGIGCYSVSPRGAARMLADCLPIGARQPRYVAGKGGEWANTGLDVEMSRHYDNWRAFLALPPLAVAPNDQSASTIRGHLAAMHDPAIAQKAIV
jgi:GR25 family glycosyltransferase involved in LPS biosynthesis